MITPLMLLLSSIREDLKFGQAIDTMYMSKADRNFILSEVHRLGNTLGDSSVILIGDSPTGHKFVDTVQCVDNRVIEISPYTSLLLTRAKKAFEIFKTYRENEQEDADAKDISTDSVILKLEGNPNYIYIHVYNIMELPSLKYATKIARLAELYWTLADNASAGTYSSNSSNTYKHLELQSQQAFWEKLLITDYVHYYGTVPPTISNSTFDTIKSELSILGFYGFVNPLQMYKDFNSSRVMRKTDINVDLSILEYLSKVIRSGGVEI